MNGNEIPEVLPQELIPPSHRDLESSVDVLKDILKHDTRARSPAGLDAGPASRMRERSFYNNTAGAGGRQDATVYKHNDEKGERREKQKAIKDVLYEETWKETWKDGEISVENKAPTYPILH